MQGGSYRKRKLAELLKTETSQTAIRLLDERLAKGSEDKTVDGVAPRHDRQPVGVEDQNEKWGTDKHHASMDAEESPEVTRHQAYLQQEPNSHFLERRQPHPDSKSSPWEVFEVGEGLSEGRAANEGKPMDSHQVKNLINSGSINLHQTLIRPSNKSQPWLKIKGHPEFKQHTQEHLANLYQKIATGEASASESQSYPDKKIATLNPTEIKMASGRKPNNQ